MSDSPPIASTQSAQASVKTQQAAATSSSQRQSAEIVVQQVSASQVSVSGTAQGQAVTLPSADINGRLDPRQRYTVSVTTASVNSTNDSANSSATTASSVASPRVSAPQPTNQASSAIPATTSSIVNLGQNTVSNQSAAHAQNTTLLGNPVLQFISTEQVPANNNPRANVISSQQLERILSLPPNQIQAARIPPSLLVAQAQIISNTGNTLSLSITGVANQAQVNFSVTTNAQPALAIGDTVNLQLKPIANQWQVLLTATSGTQVTPVKASVEQLQPVIKHMLTSTAPISATQLSNAAPQLSIDSKVLLQMLQNSTANRNSGLTSSPSSLSNLSSTNTALINTLLGISESRVQLSINRDGSAAIKNSGVLASAPPQTIAQLNVTQQNVSAVVELVKTLNLKLDAQTQRALVNLSNNATVVTSNQPVSNVSQPASQGHAISGSEISANSERPTKVNPPLVNAVREGINQIVNAFSGARQTVANSPGVQNSIDGVPSKQVRGNTDLLGANQPLRETQSSSSVKDALSTLQNIGSKSLPSNNAQVQTAVTQANNASLAASETLNTKTITAPDMTPKVKAQAIEVLHTLLRVVQARAEQPSESLGRIAAALNDTQFIEETTVKGLKEQILGQIKQGIPQGKEQDASQIRQLLTNPALSLGATQIISPVSGQGMLSGLISLIQISLASRFARSQPAQGEKLSRALNSLLDTQSVTEPNSTGKTNTNVNSKGLSEFAQLEQKHQILREISRLFAGHQSSKIGNAEQLLQGQDTFYYTLPSALANKLQDVELLIRREHESSPEEQADDAQNNKVWHLTIKLSAGDLGEVLTKAKLRHGTLELDFYTSNEQTKHQVMNFLPLFNKRLTALGIDITKSQCQLGKIPDTLRQRPYHLLQTQV